MELYLTMRTAAIKSLDHFVDKRFDSGGIFVGQPSNELDIAWNDLVESKLKSTQ